MSVFIVRDYDFGGFTPLDDPFEIIWRLPPKNKVQENIRRFKSLV
jgi:hypothetical protein